MKNRICNSLGSGPDTGKLVRKRPVHLLLTEGVLGSKQREGARGRMQKGTREHQSHFFLKTSPSLTLQRDPLDASRQGRDQRQVNKSGAKEKVAGNSGDQWARRQFQRGVPERVSPPF